jgi:predicted dehydrogenase
MDHGWHAVGLALHWFQEAPAEIAVSLRRGASEAVEDEAEMTVVFPCGEAAISLTWNAAARRNTMRLMGDAGDIRIDDDVLCVTQRGARDAAIRFDRALSDGSHHAEWFASMLPDVAAAFACGSRQLLDEAATCLSVILRAYEIDARTAADAVNGGSAADVP